MAEHGRIQNDEIKKKKKKKSSPAIREPTGERGRQPVVVRVQSSNGAEAGVAKETQGAQYPVMKCPDWTGVKNKYSSGHPQRAR